MEAASLPTRAPRLVTAAVLAVLAAFEHLVQTLGDYYGKAPHRALLTVRRRTVAVLDRQQTWRQQAQHDRSSRPHHSPCQTSAAVEQQVLSGRLLRCASPRALSSLARCGTAGPAARGTTRAGTSPRLTTRRS